MTDTAISPLRRHMIEEMTIRELGPKTQAGYIRAVKNSAASLGHSPDRASIVVAQPSCPASSRVDIPSAHLPDCNGWDGDTLLHHQRRTQ